MLSGITERLKAVETEQRANRAEIINRLERIEGKLDEK